jgi:hypothetical protein
MFNVLSSEGGGPSGSPPALGILPPAVNATVACRNWKKLNSAVFCPTLGRGASWVGGVIAWANFLDDDVLTLQLIKSRHERTAKQERN